MTVSRFISEAEAAEVLGLTRRAMRSERAKGRLPYHKVAGRVMYTEDDLVEFQQATRQIRPKCRASGKAPTLYEDTTDGPSDIGTDHIVDSASVAQRIAQELRESLRASSSRKPLRRRKAPVIPMRS